MFSIKNKKLKSVIRFILKFLLVILVFAIIKIYLIVNPNVFFYYSLKYKNFKVHSRHELDNNIYKILDKVASNLSSSELNDTTIIHQIYLCESTMLYYSLIFPFARKSTAINIPHDHNIFISNGDVLKNKVYPDDSSDQRTLSKVITHETTHTIEDKLLEHIKFPKIETWEIEGYCETVGYNDTLDIAAAKEFITNHKNMSNTRRDNYRLYYIAVSYLIKFEKMKFEDILKSNETLDDVLTKIENRRI